MAIGPSPAAGAALSCPCCWPLGWLCEKTDVVAAGTTTMLRITVLVYWDCCPSSPCTAPLLTCVNSCVCLREAPATVTAVASGAIVTASAVLETVTTGVITTGGRRCVLLVLVVCVVVGLVRVRVRVRVLLLLLL